MERQFVIFILNELKYAIPISCVNEITSACEINPIPNNVEFMEGVVNLRGTVIPVVNFSKLFNLNYAVPKEHQILIINGGKEKLGLIIDHAQDVKIFDEDYIRPMTNLIAINGGFISDIITQNEEIIQLVSIENILKYCGFNQWSQEEEVL